MLDSQEALWPRGAKAAGAKPLAKRLDSLEGKTIAFLWDYMFRGDEIFPLIERELSAKYPGIKFIGYDNFGTTHGGGEREVIRKLPDDIRTHGIDAIVSGMGC
jgi:hypothetical protein